MEVSDLPDRKFEIMGIKMLTNVRKSMYEHCENFNKEYIKGKEGLLQAAREKQLVTKKGNPCKAISGFSAKILEARGE